MIQVKATVADGDVMLEVKGHAGYAEEGPDIVCAAVSAIVQTAIVGLQQVAHAHPDNVQVEVYKANDAGSTESA